jgi:hypothetical protein
MRTTVAASLVAAMLVFGAALAGAAESPCCAAFNGMACNQAGVDTGAPGCAEGGRMNCIGGGPVAGQDPREQSAAGGCICLSFGPGAQGCISDGSTGGFLTREQPDPSTQSSHPGGTYACTRDAVVGCMAAGTAHAVP